MTIDFENMLQNAQAVHARERNELDAKMKANFRRDSVLMIAATLGAAIVGTGLGALMLWLVARITTE